MFQKSTRSLASACLLALPILCNAGPSWSATRIIDVSKATVERAINDSLSRLRIHVDNLGSRDGGSWLQQDSYVALSVRGGFEVTKRFPVDHHIYRISRAGGRDLLFYISDFNTASNGVQASLDRRRNGNLTIDIRFESAKDEIIGKCRTRRGPAWKRRWEECRLDLDRNAQINNGRLVVWAPIVVRNGRLSYGDPKANFAADVSIDSRLCDIASKKCREIEERITGEIAAGVVGNVKSALIQARPTFERALRQVDRNLRRAGVEVTGLVDTGSAYRITVKYPGPTRTSPGS